MQEEREENHKFWIGKKVKIEVLKDGMKLFFTATILEYDDNSITFIDRDKEIFSFNKNLVVQMQEMRGDNYDRNN